MGGHGGSDANSLVRHSHVRRLEVRKACADARIARDRDKTTIDIKKRPIIR